MKKSDVKVEEKNSNSRNPIKNKKFGRIIIIAMCALCIIIVLVVFNNKFKNSEKEKIDINSIELKLSDDYTYFDNTMNEFATVIVDDFNHNNINVVSQATCEINEIDASHCYKIVLDNKDTIYLTSSNEQNFDRILYYGDLYDTSYTEKVIGTVARLYIPNINGNDFEEKIDSSFLSDENLGRKLGLSYVYSHIKFEWERDNIEGTYKITFSISEYENQDQYAESEEYQSIYSEIIKTSAYDLTDDELSSHQTIDSYEYNTETRLVDINIKYENSELTKYTCAMDTQELAKNLIGTQSVGGIQVECISDGKTTFYVKVGNLNSITSEVIEANTSYFNSNYVQVNTNLADLEAQSIIDYKNSCASYDYKDVLRNPDDYDGEKTYWFGEVLQVVDKTSLYSTYRVGVSCTKYQYIGGYSCPDAIYVTYYGEENFIEEDMIKMYGIMNGVQSYITVMGATKTIPKFVATYIDLQE